MSSLSRFINPRHTCAARVTVVTSFVCIHVCIFKCSGPVGHTVVDEVVAQHT